MWEIKQAAQQSGVLEIYIYGDVESDGYDWWTDEVIRSETSANTFREELANAGLAYSVSQYFAVLTNMRSVGVMGDERTYDYAVALRAVTTTDFMTAESYDMPWSVLGTVTSRIVNEVKHVNRVFYDCTGKPPATIELE